VDTEIGGDLLDRHTVVAVASDPDDVVTELSGIRPGHNDILPAHPSWASQLRCHLFVQQPLTVRSTLTTFGMVIQSFVDQGALPRNVIALVERPADAIIDETSGTSKSWTLAKVERFRDSVRHDRLYACWLLSCYGLRRSEVLGLRWSALDGDTLLIRRGRVTVGKESDEGMPKSRRSRRDLPLPAELSSALNEFKTRQQAEAEAFGTRWSDDRLIAVRGRLPHPP
jgi:hypothetical protein